jgi:hypothetical protein
VREQQPWLDVPYAEKDEAKAAGALWDWRAKRWYAPRPGMAALTRWLPVARDPTEATGAAEATGASEASERSPTPPAGAEVRLAEALRGLTEPTVLARLTRRRPPWRVLHSVPVGSGRGDIDHVLIGPPGVVTVNVVTVNTEHHPGRVVRVDGDDLIVDRRPTERVPHARAEAERAARLLAAARGGVDGAAPPVTAALAVIAESVTTTPGGRLPQGVLVATPANLPRLVTALPAVLADAEIDELYAVARRLSTWTRAL